MDFPRSLALAAAMLAAAAAPATAQDSEAPMHPAIGPAGGLTFKINPAVPPGYDSERFVSVVRRSLRRWGDADGGLTTAAPGDTQDGVHVVGFAASAELENGWALGIYRTGVSVTQELRPGGRVCTTAHVSVPVTRTVREAYRVRARIPVKRNGKVVRRNGKVVYQLLKRRGKVVRRNGRPVYRKRTVTRYRNVQKVTRELRPVETCRDVERLQDVERYDFGLLLNADFSWAFGPAHPENWENDLESVVLHELGHASGVDHSADGCDTATPMALVRHAGDWWRSPTDVSVAQCLLARGGG